MYVVARNFTIEVSGDVKGIKSLPKQMNFAASRTINDLLDRSQKNIITELDDELIIRKGWTKPRTRYGVNLTFAKATKLEGSVHTAADWLLEEEGFHGGVKKPDHPSKSTGRTPSDLAIPDIPHARPSIRSVMPAGQKAGKLLQNTKRTKAFVIKSKSGVRLVLQRVGQDAGGALLKDSRGNLRIGRKSERVKTKVVVKAVLRPSVKVPQTKVFVTTGVKTMNERHFGHRFGVNLLKALQTAK